jgi:hypothetical protein
MLYAYTRPVQNQVERLEQAIIRLDETVLIMTS